MLIGIDGCRADVLTEEFAPNINAIINDTNTIYTLEALAEDITVSGPNWTSMLTGVHYQKHNVTGNSFENPLLDEYPNIFYHLEAKYSDISTASVVNWAPINDVIVRNATDHRFKGSDRDVKNRAIEILRDRTIDFLFVAFDDVDGAGHANGFLPTKTGYTDVVTRTDKYVGEILSRLKLRGTYDDENWLIVFTTDHGGNKDGHGGGADIPEIRNIFTIYNNKNYTSQIITDNPAIPDIAVSVLAHFGIDVSTLDVDGIARN